MATPVPSPAANLAATPAPPTPPVIAASPAATSAPAPTAVLDALGASAQAAGRELPAMARSLAVLLIGWVLAVVLARTTRRVLERAGFDERAARALGRAADGRPYPVSRWLGQAVFYTVLLFTLAAFFDLAGLELLAAPFTSLTRQVLALLPGLVTAAVLGIVAWLLAQGLGFVVRRGVQVARLEDRLGPAAEREGADGTPTVADGLVLGAQALVYLVFLPAILGALGLGGLTAPLQSALAAVLALVPGMVAAAAILVATWLLARVAGQIAGGLARAMGLDRRAAGYGVRDVRLSTAVASAVSALVAIPGFVLAVNALGVSAIAEPINEVVARAAAAVPIAVIAVALLVIAWFVGRVAADVTATVLAGLGFDRLPAHLGLAPGRAPGDLPWSTLVGRLVQAGIVLTTAIVASQQAGLAGTAAALTSLGDLALRALAGGLIFLGGLYVARLVGLAIQRVAGPGRRLLALVAQGAVLTFALAVALTEVGVAQNIVALAFMGVVAAVAGATVLAVGLGGRDLAARLLDEAYRQLEAPPEPAPPTEPPGEDQHLP